MPDAKKLAITWIELVLLILTVVAGMGIWIVSKQLVDTWQKKNEPLELNYQKEANVINEQANLTAVQGEVTALQTKLTQERVEQVTKQYLIDRLSEAQKTQTPVPATSNAELEKAKTDLETSKGLISRLSTELANKQAASATAQIDLETAKRRSAANLAWAQLKFVWKKRAFALLGFVIAVVLLLVGVMKIAGRFNPSPAIVVGGATAFLLILVGYELFEFVGAAVIGVVIVILVLMRMPFEKANPAT